MRDGTYPDEPEPGARENNLNQEDETDVSDGMDDSGSGRDKDNDHDGVCIVYLDLDLFMLCYADAMHANTVLG